MKIKSFILFVSFLNAGVWDYETHGPDTWGKTKEWSECATGMRQSPINIIANDSIGSHDDFSIKYMMNNVKMTEHKGHAIQIDYENIGGVVFKNQEYKLLQSHFHAPSENFIDGKQFPLEAHFVHKNNKDELLVVALFFKIGAFNPDMQKIIENIPEKDDQQKVLEGLDINHFFNHANKHFYFHGSLTTPPCTEGVEWIVLKESVELSQEQFDSFVKHFHANARNLQLRHDRKIYNNE